MFLSISCKVKGSIVAIGADEVAGEEENISEEERRHNLISASCALTSDRANSKRRNKSVRGAMQCSWSDCPESYVLTHSLSLRPLYPDLLNFFLRHPQSSRISHQYRKSMEI